MRGSLGRALCWAAVIAHSGFLFYLSARSDLPAVGPEIPHMDKAVHLGLYLIWGFLFSVALRSSWPRLAAPTCMFLVLLGGIAYGAFDEIHQSFVPERKADLADLASDGAGALLGALLHHALRRHYRKAAGLPEEPDPPLPPVR